MFFRHDKKEDVEEELRNLYEQQPIPSNLPPAWKEWWKEYYVLLKMKKRGKSTEEQQKKLDNILPPRAGQHPRKEQCLCCQDFRDIIAQGSYYLDENPEIETWAKDVCCNIGYDPLESCYLVKTMYPETEPLPWDEVSKWLPIPYRGKVAARAVRNYKEEHQMAGRLLEKLQEAYRIKRKEGLTREALLSMMTYLDDEFKETLLLFEAPLDHIFEEGMLSKLSSRTFWTEEEYFQELLRMIPDK